MKNVNVAKLVSDLSVSLTTAHLSDSRLQAVIVVPCKLSKNLQIQ